MTAIFRINCIQGLRKGLAVLTPKDISCRRISLSPKILSNIKEKTVPVKKKFVSFGFDTTDEAVDRHAMHQTLFVSITVCLVLGTTVIGYLPDSKGKDWAQREAYLQLRHREANGLPLVDKNVVDPSRIILPSDAELKDMEIVI